ncbi:UDP-glucosyltransferase 2-like isoform X2 [Plodia interpunctella]|uniref:UDP-glucosyltransferase 2-like isoform X2 n=1 Tax=Plodia interpunctella TaxID=58824 RepID=UPI002368A30C|nr:UDP-glucosyltransferase 2-like isoform X2 [Plodia interpunctella]
MHIYLVCFSVPVKSLNILGEGVARHLVNAGHEVTYITAFPIKEKVKNLHMIDVSSNQNIFEGDDILNIKYVLENRAVEADMLYMQTRVYEIAAATFQHENVQSLLKKDQHFDVVVADYIETELYAAFAALYNCPMVWLYSMGAHWEPLRLIEGPAHPAYSMDYLTAHVPPFSFLQRVDQLWTQIKWSFLKEFFTMPKEEAFYKQFFGPLLSERGRPLPEYRELIYNASMVLANEHHAMGNVPATPQNFRFIGGCHIMTPIKPLPQDLQTLMDNAKHGVIYFSMGSTWKSKDAPHQLKMELLAMFAELKQTVIWKHEEPLENVPKNVHIVHWAPQTSILAHPNLLFFITHGGLFSSTEALHFGVPIIGVPIYFDQFININKAIKKGYALTAELSVHWADNLRKPIQMMLTDPSYKAKAKELSNLYHDRAIPAHHELVFSVEHAVRTGGAVHLRSPALHVPLYQKLYLDLVALILLGLFVALGFYRKSRRSGKKKRD